jgi:hypothetical protein
MRQHGLQKTGQGPKIGIDVVFSMSGQCAENNACATQMESFFEIISSILIDILCLLPRVALMETQRMTPVEGEAKLPAWLSLVRQQIEKTEFGVVQVVIHDSRIVRIERTEKVLLNQAD